MDRHLLTYVAMNAHREQAALYAGPRRFPGHPKAARLAGHGPAPYEHKPGNSASYYVTLETAKGKQKTIWGVDLEGALAGAKPAIGSQIALEHTGSEAVRLPNGAMTERHSWQVRDAEALAYRQLASSLGRRRLKETTLDFAERRGIDTVRDRIDNGRAPPNRARDRFEQAAARIGERLGLGRDPPGKKPGRRQPGQQAPTGPERGRGTAAGEGAESGGARPGSRRRQREPERPPGGMTPAARWTAAIEAEAKAVRAKARRAADSAEMGSCDRQEARSPQTGHAQRARTVFIARNPRSGMMLKWTCGRRSGTGWSGRLTARASARPRSCALLWMPSPATVAGARGWRSGRQSGGIPNLPRQSRPSRRG